MSKRHIQSLFYTLSSTQGKPVLSVMRYHNHVAGKVTGFQHSVNITGQVKAACIRGLDKCSYIFAKQCNVITAQKLKQSAQMLNLYSRIYDRETARNMVSKFSRNIVKKKKGHPLGFLFGAILFSWEKERIHDDELHSAAEDMARTESLAGYFQMDSPKSVSAQNCVNNVDCLKSSTLTTEWEVVCDQQDFRLWRKPLENSHLYEYRVFGSFSDIPSRAFFAIQVDLEYRKQWDSLVVSLDLIDRDRETGSEVVRWVMHYPFPMYSREYIFKRRFKVDHDKKVMVIINRAVNHPSYPHNNKFVRVSSYKSEMIIRPHTDSFDKDGLDFVMTYYDDPQAAIPSSAYNWMASTGVHDFMKKLHCAAKQLTAKNKKSHQHVTEGWREPSEKVPM